MKSCIYCGKEFDEYDEPIEGFDCGKPVIACEECTHIQQTFVKSRYYFDEIFKRFAIQYTTNNDPCTIHYEYIVVLTFAEACEYANENYSEDELMGVEFDQYVNEHGIELTYDCKGGFWTGF